MIRSAEEFVALRESDDPDEYRRAATDAAPEPVWWDVVERYPDMKRWVVHNKTVPDSLLRALAADPDESIRAAVARKRKCDPAVLGDLARDPDEVVRLAVATNAKTPRHVLEALQADPIARVAAAARERLASAS
jgi:FMN phosphatase YigB (HAD superfamily)